MRWVALVILIVIAGIVGYMGLAFMRQTLVWAYTCDIAEGQIVTQECLEKVTVPENREFNTISSSQSIVGQWAERDLKDGSLAVAGDSTISDPGIFRFPDTGTPLGEGLYVYHLDVPGTMASLVDTGDLLSLWLYQPRDEGDLRGESVYVLLDHIEISKKSDSGIYVQFTPDQLSQMYRLREEIANQGVVQQIESGGEEAWASQSVEEALLGDRAFIWTVTQPNNEKMPTMTYFTTELDAATLDTPEALPAEEDVPAEDTE